MIRAPWLDNVGDAGPGEGRWVSQCSGCWTVGGQARRLAVLAQLETGELPMWWWATPRCGRTASEVIVREGEGVLEAGCAAL